MLKVNLQPKVTLEVKEGLKLPIWAPIVLFVVVGSVVGYTHWLNHRDIMFEESQIKQYDFQLRDFQKTLDEYQTALNEKEYLQDKRDFVNGIATNQKMWVDFFDQLKERIPKDVWLTQFEGMRNGRYAMQGNAFSFGSIGFFMIQFKSIPDVASVTLDDATGKTDAGGETAVEAIAKSFKLSGDMKLGGQTTEEQSGKGKGAAAKRGGTARSK